MSGINKQSQFIVLTILDVCIAHVIGCLQLAYDCSDVLVMAVIDLYRLPDPPPVQVHDR